MPGTSGLKFLPGVIPTLFWGKEDIRESSEPQAENKYWMGEERSRVPPSVKY